MKRRKLLRASLLLFALGVGVLGGFCLGIRVASTRSVEMMGRHILSEQAFRANLCLGSLQTLRLNHPDLAAERLEIWLDAALIDIAQDYRPARDPDGIAVKTLDTARAYRDAYPHRSPVESVAAQVDAALTGKPNL